MLYKLLGFARRADEIYFTCNQDYYFYMICCLCFRFTFARDVYEIYYFLNLKLTKKLIFTISIIFFSIYIYIPAMGMLVTKDT